MEAQRLQEYDEWVAEHLDDLVVQYPGQVVAIHQGQVVAIHQGQVVFVGQSEDEVCRQIREQGLEPMPLVFRVPREEDLQSIL